MPSDAQGSASEPIDGQAKTFLAYVDTYQDASEATKRFNSVLNEMRKRTNHAKFRIVIAEVDDGD